MNLLVVSHTPHYRCDGQIVGWGPTVREIDHLARLFEKVTHLAVLYGESAPPSSLPYTAKNVHLLPVRPAGGRDWRDKVDVARAYPEYLQTLRRALSDLKGEDVVHVRCPANLSLLSVVYLTLSRRFPRRWIKYAGNWNPVEPVPATYDWQRWLLLHNFPRSLVTINGKWPHQPSHIFSFHNPCLQQSELREGQQSAQTKHLEFPIQIIFVGALDHGKGIFEAMQIAQGLALAGIKFQFHGVGDGPERPALVQFVKNNGLEDSILFHGWLPRPELSRFYQMAHFMLFPSKSEGWPKVLSEGMAYGVVPLAGAVSGIPQTLQECGTGTALEPTDIHGFTNALISYIKDPKRWKRESLAASRAAAQFTYDAYLEHLTKIFRGRWGLEL